MQRVSLALVKWLDSVAFLPLDDGLYRLPTIRCRQKRLTRLYRVQIQALLNASEVYQRYAVVRKGLSRQYRVQIQALLDASEVYQRYVVVRKGLSRQYCVQIQALLNAREVYQRYVVVRKGKT